MLCLFICSASYARFSIATSFAFFDQMKIVSIIFTRIALLVDLIPLPPYPLAKLFFISNLHIFSILIDHAFSINRQHISIHISTFIFNVPSEQCHEVNPVDSSLGAESQTLLNDLIKHSESFPNSNPSVVFEISSLRSKRMDVIEHFMQQNTDRPNIAFDCVGNRTRICEVDFRSHGIRSTTSTTLHLVSIPHYLGQSKISNFDNSILYEQILKLKISVYEITHLQFVHPHHHLLEIVQNILQTILTSIQLLPKISITKLQNDESRTLVPKNSIDFDDMG
jgi:hypothetical protein